MPALKIEELILLPCRNCPVTTLTKSRELTGGSPQIPSQKDNPGLRLEKLRNLESESYNDSKTPHNCFYCINDAILRVMSEEARLRRENKPTKKRQLQVHGSRHR